MYGYLFGLNLFVLAKKKKFRKNGTIFPSATNTPKSARTHTSTTPSQTDRVVLARGNYNCLFYAFKPRSNHAIFDFIFFYCL